MEPLSSIHLLRLLASLNMSIRSEAYNSLVEYTEQLQNDHDELETLRSYTKQLQAENEKLQLDISRLKAESNELFSTATSRELHLC